jgi:hypothetical protein
LDKADKQDIVEKVQKEEGNPLARRVDIIHKEIPTDDPQRRRPDTTRAKETLQWQPQWNVEQGVRPFTVIRVCANMIGRGDGQILLCQDEGGCYLEQYIFEIVLRYHMGFMHRMGLLRGALYNLCLH